MQEDERTNVLIIWAGQLVLFCLKCDEHDLKLLAPLLREHLTRLMQSEDKRFCGEKFSAASKEFAELLGQRFPAFPIARRYRRQISGLYREDIRWIHQNMIEIQRYRCLSPLPIGKRGRHRMWIPLEHKDVSRDETGCFSGRRDNGYGNSCRFAHFQQA